MARMARKRIKRHGVAGVIIGKRQRMKNGEAKSGMKAWRRRGEAHQ